MSSREAIPLVVFLGLSAFVVYSTWAAPQGQHYTAGPYLSPFYSPELFGSSHHAWFGPRLSGREREARPWSSLRENMGGGRGRLPEPDARRRIVELVGEPAERLSPETLWPSRVGASYPSPSAFLAIRPHTLFSCIP